MPGLPRTGQAALPEERLKPDRAQFFDGGRGNQIPFPLGGLKRAQILGREMVDPPGVDRLARHVAQDGVFQVDRSGGQARALGPGEVVVDVRALDLRYPPCAKSNCYPRMGIVVPKGCYLMALVCVNYFLVRKRAKTSRGAGGVLHSTRPPAVEVGRRSPRGGSGGRSVGRVIHNGL